MPATLAVPAEPTALDREQAKAASGGFRRVISHGRRVRIQEVNAPAKETATIEIPAIAVDLIQRVLQELARGRAVAIVPYESRLTTQQAADVLGVSRPYLIKLLNSRELPHELVGSHRRIRLRDLMEYKAKQEKQSQTLLDEMASESQEIDPEY